MEKLCITITEMAKALSIGRETAYELARDPNFTPSLRIGKRLLINYRALQQWMDEQCSKSNK